MKRLSTFILALTVLMAPLVGQSQTPRSDVEATVSSLVTTIRNTPIAQRAQLVRDAIAANSDIADVLVGALIEAFPADAALYTDVVVKAVLALPTTNAAKSDILTKVAAAAVPAAKQIPPAAVPNLVEAINDVKRALSNVPPEFTPAVSNYTKPLDSTTTEVINNDNTQDKPVVSED